MLLNNKKIMAGVSTKQNQLFSQDTSDSGATGLAAETVI